MNQVEHVCLMASITNDPWLWHARYGHLNFYALRKLADENLVKGLPQLEQVNQVCDCCVISKQHRTSFPHVRKSQSEKHLQLMYGDLCGPISPTTLKVKLLQSKTEAFDAFKKVKNEAELESGHKLKIFQTDRGGEFTSNIFNKYCVFGNKKTTHSPLLTSAKWCGRAS